jgi:sarcosine oxidase/L-pipecolate oxidase
VSGIQASNGNQHFHPSSELGLTILALGAGLPRVVSDAKTQVTAKAWSVAHLELTSAEAALLKDAPVVSLSELGFWIEPVLVVPEADEILRDGMPTAESKQRNYLLKFAAHGGGWTNTVQDASNGQSNPTSNDRDEGTEPPGSLPPHEPIRAIPASDEQLLRELIRLTIPSSLHDRQFVKKSMCWCADTASSDFLIDFVPGSQGLLIAGADSGHAFKFLPIVGKWVAEVVKSGEQSERRWRWKTAGNRSDVGESVAWRGGSVRDLDGEAMN